MDPIALLVYLGATAAISGIFYLVASRKRRPIYGDDPRLQSGSIFRVSVLFSMAVGLLLSVFQSLSVDGLDLLGLATVALGSMVTYLLVVSVYTDHRHRMVDRVLLHWGLGIAVIFGVLRLIELQSEPLTVIFVVSILLSFAIMFVPSIGASDARAFMILFAVGIPVLGIELTWYVFLIGIALWLGYGILAAIRTRNFKVSIPLVPYILLPLALAPLVLTLSYGVPRLIEMLS